MRVNYIYVHLDAISNSVYAKGLNLIDFNQSIVQKPQNLLLLEPRGTEGEYEPHTGLRVIRGESDVSHYLSQMNRLAGTEVKWIDFKEIDFLQQLSQMEIAELLYFAHMATQLHSPFFYKLQNNYVYFEKINEVSKVFYRYLEDFYHILGHKISRMVQERTAQRKVFFKKELPVSAVPVDFLKKLKPIFQEGIALSFSQSELIEDNYRIPVFIIEDRIKEIDREISQPQKAVLTLVYHATEDKWEIDPVDWEVVVGLKQV